MVFERSNRNNRKIFHQPVSHMNGSSAARSDTEERLTVLFDSVGATGVCVGGRRDHQRRLQLQKVPQSEESLRNK